MSSHDALPRSLLLALVLVTAIAGPATPAGAQTDATAAVVREAHAFIVEYALRAVDPTILLQRAITVAQQVAAASDAPPVLTGRTTNDVAAAADYVASVLRPLASTQQEAGMAAVLRAMIRELGDPFAAVFIPSDFRRFQEELRGEHGGIGVQVDTGPAGAIVISDVTPSGPADRAGLVPGDAVEEIDGRSTFLLTPDEVLRLLHAAPGTTVSLSVRQRAAVRRLTLTRAVIRESATRARIVESRIGYLRLLEFSRQSARDLSRAMMMLRAGGVQGLVLDVRANGGGLVDEAVDIASLFLADGPVAFEERRDETEVLAVRPADRFQGVVVVLADRGSASASEIVAGALQDEGVPIVGVPTYGKTTVQSISIPALPGDWGLRVTTARYLTRARRNIDGTGLTPTLRVAMDPRLIQSSGDVQYGEALALARTRLAARANP
ncbi:MAG TPA: S41 family peptidase [bacterium]